jgi:DNA primase
LIFSDGGYWCRQCGAKGWIDENDPEPPSDEELREMRLRAVEAKAEENRKRLDALEQLARTNAHLLYHDNLSEARREYWWGEGFTDAMIDRWVLGYCGRCPLAPSSSYTIPVWGQNGQLVNIRHRLTDEEYGKYRPHVSGLGPQLFNSYLLNDERQELLLVEGEKKGIILTEYGYPAVATMGQAAFQDKWYPLFSTVERVIVGFDPDADRSAYDVAEGFARRGQKVSVADFPLKPDDMITKYGAGGDDIQAILRQATPVWRGK